MAKERAMGANFTPIARYTISHFTSLFDIKDYMPLLLLQLNTIHRRFPHKQI